MDVAANCNRCSDCLNVTLLNQDLRNNVAELLRVKERQGAECMSKGAQSWPWSPNPPGTCIYLQLIFREICAHLHLLHPAVKIDRHIRSCQDPTQAGLRRWSGGPSGGLTRETERQSDTERGERNKPSVSGWCVSGGHFVPAAAILAARSQDDSMRVKTARPPFCFFWIPPSFLLRRLPFFFFSSIITAKRPGTPGL